VHEVALFVLATGRTRRFTPTAVVALAALVGLGYVTLTWRRRRLTGGRQVPSDRQHPGRFELTGRRPPPPAGGSNPADGSTSPNPADGSTSAAGPTPPAAASGVIPPEGAHEPGTPRR